MWAELTPAINAALDDAMPVIERVFNADRAGRFTPGDTRELTESLAGHIGEIPPEVAPYIERALASMMQWVNDEGRRKGLLMVEDGETPASTPASAAPRSAPTDAPE